MKKIVFSFGRMNPPTVGHQKLVDKVNAVAKSNGADARVYLSHTSVQTDPKNKKDPLSYKEKIRFARKAFGSTVVQSPSKTVFDVLKEIGKGGYTDVIMVVGSDRVSEFKRLLEKYNGKDYNFDSIQVVSAGERDPDAEGVEGMSASKLRALAKEGDFETFKKGLPKKLNDSDAKKIYDTIRSVITEEIEEERKPLTIMQRQKRARMMKRLAPKLARFRKMKAKRMADREKLLYRAQKAARNIIRTKVAGERGSDYSSLTPASKITIDKLVAKKSAIVKRLAKRLLPKVRKSEMERLKKARSGPKNEELDYNNLFESLFLIERQVPEDPDIKDRKGSQPKKYHSGLSKSTKVKRDAAFQKGAKKDSSDPSAYPEKHPGDDDAKTKTSKHTKKYNQMFGEQDAVKRAKEVIKREKESDKAKHDALLDRARIRDTQAKNRQTEEYELTEDSKAALQKKADKSGIPYGILKKVYDRGMAAWRTGHRPGATQQQWAYARVNSFITGGKTRTTADADLWKQAKGKKEEIEVNEMYFKVDVESLPTMYIDASSASEVKKNLRKLLKKPDMIKDVERVTPVEVKKHFRDKAQGKEEPELDENKGPCWDGYKQVGMKKGKGGKPVPNCVKEEVSKKKNLKAMLGVPFARPSTPPQSIEEDWFTTMLGKYIYRKGYKAASELLKKVLDRKKKEKESKTDEYYAAQIAKQFQGVDARQLMKMVNEQPEKMDAPEIGTDKIRKRYSDMTPGQIDESYSIAPTAGEMGIKATGAFAYHPSVEPIEEDYLGWEDDAIAESAEYQGRKVKLNDPFRSSDGKKKFYVYVKNEKGNVIKLGFGDPNMEIKRDDPERRKSYRARHGCDNPGPKWKANYWSCKMWSSKPVSKLD